MILFKNNFRVKFSFHVFFDFNLQKITIKKTINKKRIQTDYTKN